MADSGLVFLVRRDDLASTRIDSFDANAPLDAGELRCRIDHFAFTANNITYAVFGDAMHYWQFFPAPAGWGCVPVWGFATVQESRCDGLAVGERLLADGEPCGAAPRAGRCEGLQRRRSAPRRPACGLQPLPARRLRAPATRRIAKARTRCCGRCSPPPG